MHSKLTKQFLFLFLKHHHDCSTNPRRPRVHPFRFIKGFFLPALRETNGLGQIIIFHQPRCLVMSMTRSRLAIAGRWSQAKVKQTTGQTNLDFLEIRGPNSLTFHHHLEAQVGLCWSFDLRRGATSWWWNYTSARPWRRTPPFLFRGEK